MVSVSKEPPEQTDNRLRRVIARADLIVHDGVWCFEEFPTDKPPALTGNTLAVVRDDQSWSRLVPLTQQDEPTEHFGIFSVHFPPGSTTAASAADCVCKWHSGYTDRDRVGQGFAY